MFDVEVQFGRVNIRRGPGVGYGTLEQLEEAGQRLQAVGRTEDGTWVQICCVDVGNGWISAEVISPEGDIAALRIAEIPPTLAIIQAELLNVRAGPQTAFNSIGEVALGESFEILARSTRLDWYKICCVNGQEGWVFSDSVTVDGDLESLPVGDE